MLRINSPLDEKQELLVSQVIGCCVSVHRQLGPGFLESVYSKALGAELGFQGIPFEREVVIPISYRGRTLAEHRLDFVVAAMLVMELKSVERLAPVHGSQVLSYLKASGLRVGLLVNFNQQTLAGGAVRRVVL